jgi:hypothetical protein
LQEPDILGLLEGTSIQQVDLALRLLDEADDREKTHKNFEKLRRAQARRGGLIHFVRHFWSVLEPSTKLIEGWPLEAICLHLEAVTFGEINRLLINVPPGFMKSLLVNVFWPAWEWGPMGLAHLSSSSSHGRRDG